MLLHFNSCVGIYHKSQKPFQVRGGSSISDLSPRSTGPAGSQFEAKVGTHYALALLASTEPFGLPGAIIDRIEFQRGGQGHPLDDLIVHGKSAQGEDQCLEVQIKRAMKFTVRDENFTSIVDGIFRARSKEPNRRFAVAIERTTGAIDNGVQEALELAQQTIDATSFLRLLKTPGRSNQAMRAFVEVFKRHLADAGEAEGDSFFQVLRSFSVLTFDFARPNSIAEHHDRFRARQLASAKGGSDLYDSLFGLVLRADAIGGELDRSALICKLKEIGIEVGSAPTLALARRHIEELSRHALDDICLTITGIQLLREKPRRELESLLGASEVQSAVVEISGPSGAGKSGLLRTVIEGRGLVSRILVLAPDRTPPGGWPELRTRFGIQASAEEFLRDLACDGGGYLFIDGLDRFRDNAQRKTVVDLLRAGLRSPGLRILFTVRSGWKDHVADWIGEETFGLLSQQRSVIVGDLDDDEANALATARPQIAHLLRPDHRAKPLARNLFKLRQLVGTRLNTSEAISEADLASEWLASGAKKNACSSGKTRSRKRVIYTVGKGLVEGDRLVDVSGQDPQAVGELIKDGVLVEFQLDRVRFLHDVFVDWAVGCVLSDDPKLTERLDLDAPPPFWMAPGFELACRILAEGESDKVLPTLVEHLEGEDVAAGWASLALLALVRSERAEALLGRYDNLLMANNGGRTARLIRRFIASHTQSAATLLNNALPEEVVIPESLPIPKGPGWIELIRWCLQRFDRLESDALSAVVDLFQTWLVFSAFGEKTVSPILLDRLADVLIADIEFRDLPLPRYADSRPEKKFAVTGDACKAAQLLVANFASVSPDAAARYLNAVKDASDPEAAMCQVLENSGRLTSVAPAEFSAAFLRASKGNDENGEYHDRSRHRRSYALMRIENLFVVSQCGIGVFAEILQAAPETGISLVLSLTMGASAPENGDSNFPVVILGETRKVIARSSYGWSRGRNTSIMLAKALIALEHWAHQRLDEGEVLESVIGDIVSEGPIPGAVWLVIVDLVLSHSSLDGRVLRELLASPETMALDVERATFDALDRKTGGRLRGHYRPEAPAVDQAVEGDLANRPSRKFSLHDLFAKLVFILSDEELSAIRERLDMAVERLGPWTEDRVDLFSSKFMASYASRRASRDNYEQNSMRDTSGKEHKAWTYVWPPDQKRWMEKREAIKYVEHSKFNRSLAVCGAMDDENNSISVGISEADIILDETLTATPSKADDALRGPNDPWLSRVSAAAFFARMGSASDLARRRSEITSTFEQALQFSDQVRVFRSEHVMYDPHSLAIAGLLYLATTSGREADVERLEQAVIKFPESAAQAFLQHRKAVAKLDETLLISLCRLALLACWTPRRAKRSEEDDVNDKRVANLKSRLTSANHLERTWRGGGSEPEWPRPPEYRPKRPMRTLTNGTEIEVEMRDASSESDFTSFGFDQQTGTAWIQILNGLGDSAGLASQAVWSANLEWLLATNRPNEDGNDNHSFGRVWTQGLMVHAATHARYWSENARKALVFDVLKNFSDEAFILATSMFIVESDMYFIKGNAADRSYLLSLRNEFWPRLKHTSHWQRHLRSRNDGSIEGNLNKLVNAYFMRESCGFREYQSYSDGLSGPQLLPFLPLFSKIANEAPPCPNIVDMFLNYLECLEPSTAEVSLVAAAVLWARTADDRFWIEFNFGPRILSIARNAVQLSDASGWHTVCEALMTAGVMVDTDFLRRVHGKKSA